MNGENNILQRGVSAIINRAKHFVKNCRYRLLGWYWYEIHRVCLKQVPLEPLKQEYKKYKDYMCQYNNRHTAFLQLKAFLTSRFALIADNTGECKNADSPTVFVVVRNELERMKVFFDHYRTLGVERFVILDNGSHDGTLELAASQRGTKVYQVLDDFETHKKEGWIEKMLVLNGYNRWCVVVDSDELLDFVESEHHSLTEMIQAGSRLGYTRLGGALLDMYAREALFTPSESYTHTYRYFDKSSYTITRPESDAAPCGITIYGGPRDRLLGGKRALSKQSVFYFGKESLYAHCHFMYPFVKCKDVPCWYVLRHYKFLQGDKMEYLRRADAKCFYNHSVEYQIVRNLDNSLSMYCDGDSQEYTNSCSLRCLPYLEDIHW